MMRSLLKTVNDRFENISSEPLYYLAAILDPMYKDNYFDTNTKQVAINMLQKEAERMMRSNSDTATEKPKQEGTGEQPQHKTQVSSHNKRRSVQKVMVVSIRCWTCMMKFWRRRRKIQEDREA